MKAFSQYMLKQFVHQMVTHLRRDFVGAVAQRTDEELETVVGQAIASGVKYGLELEWEVEKLLEVMISLGDDFDTKPETNWVEEILRQSDLDSAARFEMIFVRLEKDQ